MNLQRTQRRPLSWRCRRGSYAILLALTLMILLGMAALAIDVSFLHTISYEAQNAATVGSHAAAMELRDGGGAVEIEAAMQAALAANNIAGAQVDTSNVDLDLTHWDFAGSSDDLSPFSNAARVQVSLSQGNGNAIGLLLGPLLGVTTSDIRATATTALRTWEVMVVQDVSKTMEPHMADAIDAVRDFLAEIWNSPLDSVGMVAFDGMADALTLGSPWTQLTPLVSNAAYMTIDSQWSGLAWAGHNNGANHGAGITLAVDELVYYGDPEAFRAIVIVTNRAPYRPISGTAFARAAAISAADDAADEGISVFVVYYDETGNPGDAAFMEGLTRGVGTYYEVTDPADLPLATETVAHRVPVALVK